MCKKTFFLTSLVLVLVLVNSVSATTFYVDPVSGSMSNNGSESYPWSTLEAVFDNNKIETKDKSGNPKNSGAPVKAGDTIKLLSGYHGDIYESVYFNDNYITIEAASGATAELKRFRLSGGKKWILRGLDISPSHAATFERVTMVNFYSRNTSDGICSDITIEDCNLYTIADSSGWSANDWDTKACHGINLGMDGGSGLLAKNNYILNVNYGITAEAQYAVAEDNIVENFSGDGITATYHDVVVKYNLIKNCYAVNDNHDDGIQTYLRNVGPGAVYRVTLLGNIIINTSDPDQPHQGTLQGIGIFDGPHYDFVIENNLVCTNHWHGITLKNSEDGQIVNNTVFSKWWYDSEVEYKTWIQTTSGTTSGGNLVRNNIAHTIDASGDSSATVDNNLTISRTDDADDWFVNYSTFNMHTASSSSPQVDEGSSSEAPSIDIEGTSRPQGSYYDIGAYEYVSGDTTAPSPDPMTWSTDPYATGTTSISMTATTATDSSGVEYYFDCTAGGGSDSGWQDSTTYSDTGLSASTQYTYRVKARDKSANQNETAYSTTKSATTDSEAGPEPVSWWKLDESSGTNADDSSGNNHDGTLTGGSWAPTGGKFDGAVDLGAATSDRVQVPTTSMSASAGTVALWGRIEDTQSGCRYFFGHTSNPPSWADRIQIYVDNSDNQLDLGLGDTHTKATNIMTLSANTWYHIALTWDSGDYVVYVDGLQKASGTYTGLSSLGSYADIGNNGDTSGTYRVEAFQGKLDEVRIYDEALSKYDVADLAGITIASSPSPADEATSVSTTADLSWSAGYYAASSNGHDVYFGTDYNSVADANHSSSEFKGNQSSTTYDPGTMSNSTTYYWAIDEINDTYIWQGDVWSFTTASSDTTAPSPDPMTWSTEPYATGTSSISMTATTATDVSGVEYYFDCTAGGGNDSGWQDSTSYTDTGLDDLTEYTYRVKARDKSANQNETAYSTTKSATTQDGTAPSPDPMTWSTEPYATGTTSISMTATTATDTSGVEYYFDCTAGGGNDSGWQDSTTYEDTALSPETQYTYQVRARDKSTNQNATGWSTTASATTDAEGDPNLVSWWKLDESSGTTAADSSGNDHDGTLSGGSWAPTGGKYDGAVDLGDATSDRVQVPTTGMSASVGTITLWGRIEGTQTDSRYFFGHTTGSSPANWDNRIQLYMDNSDNQLDLGLGDTHTKDTNIATLSADTWYHIALTWDGTNYIVYIDGDNDANGTYSGLSSLNSIADFGNDGNSGYRIEAFQGKLDQVRIYDKVLSQSEIQDLVDE